jgi:hypothetical protein
MEYYEVKPEDTFTRMNFLDLSRFAQATIETVYSDSILAIQAVSRFSFLLSIYSIN